MAPDITHLANLQTEPAQCLQGHIALRFPQLQVSNLHEFAAGKEHTGSVGSGFEG